MLVLIWLFLLAAIYFYFFRESFLSELAISFLPYIMVAILVVIIILIFLLFRKKKKNLISFFTVVLMTLSFWMGYLYYSEYFSFYNNSDESIRLTENKWIKVFYSNILYTNDDFQSLEQKIQQENPDIVILVEFSDDHEKEMKDFFKENYPYMNRNSRSIKLAGDVVFSKIPLENATTTWLSWKWTWKYSYMQINCEDIIPNCENKIDLYVVHTAAPVSLENFEMRNNQLEKVWIDLTQNSKMWDSMVVIWDFNLSPRSYYYKQLTKDWNLLNVLSFQSPNYTRSLWDQKIFRSHIDQIFISPEVKISEINIEDLTWSDHRSFTFRFWL